MVYVILLFISAFGAFQSFGLKETSEEPSSSLPKNGTSESTSNDECGV